MDSAPLGKLISKKWSFENFSDSGCSAFQNSHALFMLSEESGSVG